jgi:ABC-type nitrate/sulfonate/bicarbonate transport system substrate-binding protein
MKRAEQSHRAFARRTVVISAVVALLIVGWYFSRFTGSWRRSPSVTSVRLAINPVPLGALPIIADKASYWKANGLEVQMLSFPSGKASLDAVLSGGADFATAAETPIMHAGLAGFSLAVLATIASSSEDCKACYRPDHGITNPSDLRGKKVATAFGTSAEYFMDTFLRHHGIRRDEVTALNMKPAEMVNTLNRGDISAFFVWEPYPLEAGKILKGNTGIFLGGGIYTETFQIVTRREYAQTNAETCQRVLRALIAAEQHAAQNEQNAAEKVAAFTQLAPADVSAIWKNFQFRVGLNADFVGLLESQASWARARDATLATNVSFESLLWPEPLREIDSTRVSLKP